MSFSHQVAKVSCKGNYLQLDEKYSMEKGKNVLTNTEYYRRQLSRLLCVKYSSGKKYIVVLDKSKYNKDLIIDLVKDSNYTFSTLTSIADYVFKYLNLGSYDYNKLSELVGQAYDKGLKYIDAWADGISKYIRLYKS